MNSLLINHIEDKVKLDQVEKEAVSHAFGNTLILPKDALLYPVNAVCKYVYFIEEGIVRHTYLTHKGENITCDFSTKGQFFTDFASFNYGQPSLYQFSAIEPLCYLRINLQDLRSLYARHPKIETFGRLIAEQTAERITQMARSLISEKASDRYERLLKEKPELLQRVPQKYIAAYLGIKPESLSRIRKSFLE
jgi:CRP/FNR family transcriptional regulator, anaerobic regulatory protein